ncbi:MAG: two-component system, NarL family, response regulator DevR [Pseudonocardiales bacterium]|jgi:DNA-binding NarL/FixJ family response regulator|nr:two-component system, NarL family, response regulator DevR [Pseudonocardiales bacterium]
MSDRITVVLVDDHEIVRRGVRDLLAVEPDLEVLGEAGTAAEAMARILALRPDVAVLDVRLPDGDGVTLCRDLRSALPGLHVLMLTSFADDDALYDAILAGADGYVLKRIGGSELVDAIRAVGRGASLLDPAVTGQVLARLRNPPQGDHRLATLTEQERRVLDLVADGLTNRQIGAEMFLAEKTIKNYVSSIFAKLGLERRAQAAVYGAAVRAGALDSPALVR